MPHSVLVVPVPTLEPLVRARHAHYDRDYVSADPSFAHAHITVLAPFVDLAETDRAHALVGEIASSTTAFDYTLERVATFPNGIVHLVPEPEEPFRALVAAVARAFPAHPPYGGQFADVRPHVTVDALGPQVTEQTVREWVAPILPVRERAHSLQLSWYEPRSCRTLARWQLTGAPGA